MTFQPSPRLSAPDDDSSDIDYTDPAQIPQDPDEALDRIGWHMRMARKAEDERMQIMRQFDQEVNRVTEWCEHRLRIARNKYDWHAQPIESFHRMMLEADSHCKTIHTPHGRSKISVPKAPKVSIDDKEAVTKWAADTAPDIVTQSVNVSAVQKLVDVHLTDDGDYIVTTPSGEVVPGVSAELPGARWSLDVDPGSPL